MRSYYIALVSLLFVFLSCGERVLIRNYYILELPSRGSYQAIPEKPLQGTCEILDTKVPPAYAQQRIAVRIKSHEISYYQYHYWAVNPSENFTSLLEQQIQMSGIFADSKSGFLKKIPDYQISSRVYNLETLDKGEIFYAHLQMEMQWLDVKSGMTLVRHNFDRTKALEERDLNQFAAELSVIFQEETDHFLTKIKTYLEKNNPHLPANLHN
jgi:ABC-type uncharacterized transport system auxiliary subunit